MAISLTLFLNINFLILALFPYISMFPCKKSEEAKSYAISFCSNAAFLICYSIFSLPVLQKDLFSFSIDIKKIFVIFLGCILSLGLEILIFFIKYKEIKFVKCSAEKKSYILFYLLLIPILEEIIYLSCLYGICKELFIPDVFFVILSAISFGVSHFRYPKINILTKSIWGLIFAIFYLIFNSLYLVIIIHIFNNLIIYFLGRKINATQSSAENKF